MLGPLEAVGPSGAAVLVGGKQRLLLAILVLHAGELVARSAIIDALWPEDPPASAAQSVESYVSRLRAALRAAGATQPILASAPGGYRLLRDGNRFDRDAFTELASRARSALEDGDAAGSERTGRRSAGAVARPGTGRDLRGTRHPGRRRRAGGPATTRARDACQRAAHDRRSRAGDRRAQRGGDTASRTRAPRRTADAGPVSRRSPDRVADAAGLSRRACSPGSRVGACTGAGAAGDGRAGSCATTRP